MELADPNDPLVTGGGELITPERTEVSQEIAEEQRRILPLFVNVNPYKQLHIDKLPEPEKREQAVICAVIGARLMGLQAVDIAEVLATDLVTVEKIFKRAATQQSFEKIFQNIINSNSDTIQGRISSHANQAVDVMFELMTNKDIRDDVRFKAAQDTLDRSGTNADQFFHQKDPHAQADDELRIVIMDDEGENEKVKVEIKRNG